MMTKPCRITVSEKIRAYRIERGISQSVFGKLIGVSAQAVFKWERNICYPDITLLPRLAEILRCSICDFFE